MKDAHKAYTAALAQWRAAERAAVELRAQSREADNAAAQAALDAARNGQPIPPAKRDGIGQSIEAAERAVDAYLTITRDAEEQLLDALRDHLALLDTTAREHAHAVTQRMLDRIGQVLTEEWGAYVRAQDLAAACEMGKPWLGATGQAPRVRYEGQNRNLGDLLGDVLRTVDRTDPVSAEERTEIALLQRTGSRTDHAEAVARYDALPVPTWAAALGVEP